MLSPAQGLGSLLVTYLPGAARYRWKYNVVNETATNGDDFEVSGHSSGYITFYSTSTKTMGVKTFVDCDLENTETFKIKFPDFSTLGVTDNPSTGWRRHSGMNASGKQVNPTDFEISGKIYDLRTQIRYQVCGWD